MSGLLNTLRMLGKKYLPFFNTHSSTKVRDTDGSVWNISLQTHTLHKADTTTLALAGIYPSNQTITYSLHIPALSSKDTLLAIRAYIEEQLGPEIVQSSTIVFLEQKNRRTKEKKVTAVLSKNSDIESWLSHHNQGAVTCRWFFPKQLCLQAFHEAYCPKERHIYLVDTDTTESTLLHIQTGSLIACRTIPRINQEGAHQQMIATLLSWNSTPSDEPALLIMTGDPTGTERLINTVPCQFYTPPEDQQSLFTHARCVGAALLSQPTLVGPVPPTLASSEKRPLLKSWLPTLALCGTVSLFISLLFFVRENAQEKILRKSLEIECNLLSKEPWATALQAKFPVEINSPYEAEEAIAQIQTEIKKNVLFPLQPNIPQVAEVMQWIAEEIKKVAPEHNTFAIQKLVYSFIQYPSLEQPQKHYQLKIDLEFSTPDAQVARSFHDLLLSKNSMIDSSSDIQWSVSNGMYRTSFFIQDKTKYSTAAI